VTGTGEVRHDVADVVRGPDGGTAGRVPAPDLDEQTAARLRHYRLPDGRSMDLFLAVAHHPAALDDLRRATTTCLRDLGLSVRDRELVILRTLARAGAEAEWALHVHLFADDAGLSPEDAAATCRPDHEGWEPRERDLIELADFCHDSAGAVPDDVWRRWQERWPIGELIALITVAGQYRKVALLTNALALPVPAGLPTFPATAGERHAGAAG
jgi:alkylhydroperoxidase family enzyme